MTCLQQYRGSRCVVTGGAGAIGSNTVRALLESEANVMIIDDFSSGSMQNLENFQGGLSVIRGSITSEEVIDAIAAEEPHYLFHFAAHFANQNSVDHPVADLHTNGVGTVMLLDRCRTLPSLKRFVYASSSCVLGFQASVLDETTPTMPDTPYAISKLAGEQYSLFYSQHFDVPATVLRYFNVYGPGERPGKYRNVIPNFIAAALRGEPLIVTGTGAETREFVFVADAVRATLLAASCEAADGEVFHVGSGQRACIRDVAEQIVRLCGGRSEIRYQSPRSWDKTPHRATRSDKLANAIGHWGATRLTEGLSATVAWVKATC
jgi:UDP-glucose 4-epimerase